MIKQLKNNRIPRTDVIRAEMIIYTESKIAKALQVWMTTIWKKDTMPGEKNNNLLSLHKRRQNGMQELPSCVTSIYSI